MRLDGARILLTGATGGIGRAIARALTKRGGVLVMTGRRTDVLEELVAEVDGTAVPADLADRTSVARLMAQVGDVDVVVANAALPATGLLTSFTVDQIDRALDINLRAPLVIARLAAAGMIARRRGHLVFVSSLSGKVASGGTAVYSATKFGLRGFGLALRDELQAHGVGVSTVFPGFVRDAGMFADTGVRLPPGIGTSTPEAVARAVVRAVERNRGEIDVAPLPMRVGARFATVAPGLFLAVQRRLGARRIVAALAEKQAAKR